MSESPTRDRMQCWATFYTVPNYHTKEVNREMGLSASYQITIRFDMNFKTLARVNVRTCIPYKTPQAGNIMDYTNPLNILSSSVTMNWAGFIKMHLKRPHVD
jgi:hypothetical protein